MKIVRFRVVHSMKTSGSCTTLPMTSLNVMTSLRSTQRSFSNSRNSGGKRHNAIKSYLSITNLAVMAIVVGCVIGMCTTQASHQSLKRQHQTCVTARSISMQNSLSLQLVIATESSCATAVTPEVTRCISRDVVCTTCTTSLGRSRQSFLPAKNSLSAIYWFAQCLTPLDGSAAI